jgi:radical SAM protein with 4Fe4S-binding SPASM domain
MRYYLPAKVVLKWLEVPSVYHIERDELYELDNDSFQFLQNCSSQEGQESKDGAFIDYCMEEGLLTTDPVSARRPLLTQSPIPSLRYLEMQITDSCNLQCKHCYIKNSAGNELSSKQIKDILTELEEMQGLRVLITGGEPLLHRNFDVINEMLPDFSLRAVLFTNGLLLKKERLRNLNVREIQVSIDGLESGHDQIRGIGTYRAAMDAIELARDAGFSVSISTMIHRKNLADFDNMERLFKNLGIKDWAVDIPCSTGRLSDNEDFCIAPEEGAQYLGYGYGGGLHSSGTGYGCGLHLMAVLADGRTAKCAFYEDKTVGAIADGLRASWQRVTPIKLQDLKCNCEFLDVCRGGCRYRAESLEGKGGKDRYRCKFYGIL